MTISSVLSTAVSALAVNSARVATSAHNIANINTDGYLAGDAREGAASPLVVSQAFGAGAVQVEAIEASNVDIGKEFIDIIAAKVAYEANVQVVKTGEEMLKESIDIKA